VPPIRGGLFRGQTVENAKKHDDIIASIESGGFVSELLTDIFDRGFGACSKNDLYDLILHLANRHSSLHFLDTRSNYQNAVMLKVTERKIKNSKLNIALKYKSAGENKTVLIEFLTTLTTPRSAEKLERQRTDTHISFVIENPAVKMELENILKNECLTTFDYHFNTELVKIDKLDFLELLKVLSGMTDAAFLSTLNKEINSAELDRKIRSGIATSLRSVLTGIKDILTQISAGVITGLISTTIATNN
jgi:hypothetical protein